VPAGALAEVVVGDADLELESTAVVARRARLAREGAPCQVVVSDARALAVVTLDLGFLVALGARRLEQHDER
jgi:hypothetical protein